ncbi:PE-PPE domain-containing protein [Mycobacterium simiae]|uniref:PE-PPE domain-containing protein n=1 Tax=Mycobacterium simiae TaxID=1784 RepID=A0A5B1BMB8_MYCSI|nr:PE-PPE domain-containing protein [Mycobacterium simiae]KAA1248533.1 PE-PPE domain-containing protein [Mycobacterium simiae]
MSFVVAEPEVVASAASGLARVGATVDAAISAAMGPTTRVMAAAGDEVSAAIAALFGDYGAQFQSLSAQLSAFHNQIVRGLDAAAEAYAAVEAANSSLLRSLDQMQHDPRAAVSTSTQALLEHPPIANDMAGLVAGTGGPTEAGAVPTRLLLPLGPTALIMGPTGNPLPTGRYLWQVFNRYIRPFYPGALAVGLTTPEQFQPFSGIPSLTFDESVAQGASILHGAIMSEYAAGREVVVLGFSQSSSVAAMEMRYLASLPPDLRPSADQLSFVLLGSPSNPNGGILARFPDVRIQPLGVTFSGAIPDTIYPTTVYTRQYDGWADFPQYPANIVADVNAMLGIFYSHGTYEELTPAQIAAGIVQPVSPAATDITYIMIPTENLPLLEPLRGIVPEPLLDLVQPNLRVIVELGYDRTGYADVHTPAGLFPTHVDPIAVMGDLAVGTQQGINDALAGVGLPLLPDLPLPPALDLSTPLNSSLPISILPPAMPTEISVPPQLGSAISGPLDYLDHIVSTAINDEIDPAITSTIYQVGDSLSAQAVSYGAPAEVVNAITIGQMMLPVFVAAPGYFVTSDLHYLVSGINALTAGDLGGFNQYMQLIPATNIMFVVFGPGIGGMVVAALVTGQPLSL